MTEAEQATIKDMRELLTQLRETLAMAEKLRAENDKLRHQLDNLMERMGCPSNNRNTSHKLPAAKRDARQCLALK